MPTAEPDRPTLTADDIAADLRIPRRTVLEMAQTRELPMFKVRRSWRISPDTYDDWKRAREASLIVPRPRIRRRGHR
jgi:excisionase family DNA binding protein